MNLFNARSEGDYNQDDNPTFKGAAGIILKKAFRKPIRTQRCIVIASAFIEGSVKLGLSKPYLVYLRKHQNPFAMAGIWDTWLNPKTGFPESSFAIITTTANSLLRQIGNPRMPVILSDGDARRWIKQTTELSRITSMLKHYDSNLMNAYPIDPKIKNPEENDKQFIQPIGNKILLEESFKILPKLQMNGYYQSQKRRSSNEPKINLAELAANSNSKSLES
jgi:putative SOS response-associated peptidase YedK